MTSMYDLVFVRDVQMIHIYDIAITIIQELKEFNII